ncbi:MAG: acyltransferase family protein [Alphaproteobacteria bacterium]|nr:acyltransferase family protein [Alphaproteobacteria bacterium]
MGVNPPPKLEWLQAGRAFAALSVASLHAAGAVARHVDAPYLVLFGGGHVGVDIFFVISGFIMMHVHGKEIGRPERAAHFVYRRVTRIYPLYWVVFALVIPLYFAFPDAGDGRHRELSNLLTSFFLLPSASKPLIGVAWTLVLEMIFYAVFTVLILSRRWGAMLFAAWIALILLHAAIRPAGDPVVGTLLNVRCLEFMAGMVVAVWASHLPGRMAVASAITGLVGLVAAALVLLPGWYEGPRPMAVQVVLMVFCAGAVAGLVSMDVARVGRAPRLVVVLGNATYSIYLVHWLIGWVLTRVLQRVGAYHVVPSGVIYGGIVLAMAAGGVVVYFLVERPLLALAARYWRLLAGGRVAPAPRAG